MLSPSDRQKYFAATLSQMPFAQSLDFRVIEVQPNLILLEMTIEAEKHANLLGVVHGGVLMSLADTAMGFACANLGSLPTTLDFNINFLKSIEAKGTIQAAANIIHCGRHTIVAEAEVYQLGKKIAAKAGGTFFVLGKIDELKSKAQSDD